MKLLLPTLVLVWAGGAAAAPLSLDQAIEEALAGSLPAAFEAEARAAGAAAAAARQGRWPKLSASVAGARSDQPVAVFGALLSQERFSAEHFDPRFLNRPSALSDWRTSIDAEQLISDGGRLAATISAADERAEAARLVAARSRQETVARVIGRYAGAVAAGRELAVAEGARDAALRHAELAAALYTGGLAVESDALLAQARVSELEEAVVRARSAREVAYAALALELGRSQDAELELPEELPAPPDETLELADAERRAALDRPDLEAFARSVDALRWEASAAARFRRPAIAWRAGVEHHAEDPFSDGGTSWGAAVVASVALLDRPATARAAAAAEQVRAAEARLERRREEVRLEVRQAVAQRKAADDRLQTALDGGRWAARSLEIVRDRYREGLATIVDLLDAESAHTRALAREVAARRDLLVTAAALELAVGGRTP